MVNMPIRQVNHNYIGNAIIPWLNLHFPADPEEYSYNGTVRYGRVFLGFHREDEAGSKAPLEFPAELTEDMMVKIEDVKDIGTADELAEREEQGEEIKRPHNGLWNLSRPDVLELRTFIPQMHISPRLDYYIMANSVKGVSRRNADVFAMHNIVIDIDCHDGDKNPAELAQALDWRLKRDMWSSDEVPCPNSIVKTGRGMQLWWAITPLPVAQSWKYLKIVNWLMDQLQELIDECGEELEGVSIDRGASKRLAGWFRLPLTYNTKAKRRGSMEILRTERYEHHTLYKKYVPKGYKSKEEKRQRRVPAKKNEFVQLEITDGKVFAGGSSNMALRVSQLCQLRSLRKAANNRDEMRDRFCLAVYSALLADYDADEAWGRLLRFNDGFFEPMDEYKLAQNMRTAGEIGGYRLSNEWVIDALEITEEEQDIIGLHPKGTVKPKKKSNYTRDLLRSIAKTTRDSKILELWHDGRRKADIARELEIGRNTVARVIKAYEEALEAQMAAEMEALEAEVAQGEMQAAAGAEVVAGNQKNRGEKCTKTGRNNYASYAPVYIKPGSGPPGSRGSG